MDTDAPSTPKPTRKVGTATVVAITLGCVFVFEKAVSFVRTSDYEARAKRSDALLTAQEQRTPKYDEYYKRIEEDQKRTRSLIEAQERANARFQQVLDTWEHQQKEYQTYLDSLKRPQ